MDTDLLKTFVVLAEEKHILHAEARLERTQGELSAELRALEELLEQTLFTRSRHDLTLTEAGSTFLRYARSALEQIARGREALVDIGELRRGNLTISAGSTVSAYILPRLLARFHTDYPGVNIFAKEQSSARTISEVVAGRVELGIITAPPGGRLRRETERCLELDLWLEDDLRLVVPPGHPLGDREAFRWAELEDLPLALFEPRSAARRLLDARLRREGVAPRVVMELRSIESVRRVVALGMAAGFISAHALERDEGLRCAEGGVQRQLAIIHRKEPLSRVASTFLDRLLDFDPSRSPDASLDASLDISLDATLDAAPRRESLGAEPTRASVEETPDESLT